MVQLPPVGTVPPVEGHAFVPLVREKVAGFTDMLLSVRGAVPMSDTVIVAGELDVPTLLVNEIVPLAGAGARLIVGKFAVPDRATCCCVPLTPFVLSVIVKVALRDATEEDAGVKVTTIVQLPPTATVPGPVQVPPRGVKSAALFPETPMAEIFRLAGLVELRSVRVTVWAAEGVPIVCAPKVKELVDSVPCGAVPVPVRVID